MTNKTEGFASPQNENKAGETSERTPQGNSVQANIPNFNDQIVAPSINLPKGGGAIQGIGEKFEVSPVTGTGAMSVPIAISPGRSGFSPALALSYDSGSGNSPFGLGWNIGVPSISRKTQKGLPRYRDAIESDTFLIAGAEDLVPIIDDPLPTPPVPFQIQRYRPRIEGLFARIERWTSPNGRIHWRSISKDNITTIYGESDEACIFHPADVNRDTKRIFRWNIERSFDDKGNVILYEYKREDGVGIENSLVERNRRNGNTFTQLYLKRVLYGNVQMYNPANLLSTSHADWHFQLVFDYGEHAPPDAGTGEIPVLNTEWDWLVRRDSFSSFRSGFDIRTYRLCRRVMMFHQFSELGSDPVLVKSTEFEFDQNELATQLLSIGHRSYEGDAFADLPPVEFTYSAAEIDSTVHHLAGSSLENLPVGLSGSNYQFVDLDGEGLSGVLSQYPEAWYYKRNLGNGTFGAKEVVDIKPSLAEVGNPVQQLSDLDGNGQLNLVVHGNGLDGYYELDEEGRWGYYLPFQDTPNINWVDPNLRFIDLNGDGHADILITENDQLIWYASKEKKGYADLERVAQFLDEEAGPKLVFNDGTQTIFLADMVGDGLTDLVRIRNGEVCYWANMGYGQFSPKISMQAAPTFDHPHQFDPGRIRLADIDGTGTTDILYLGKELIQYWHNQSGNSWVQGDAITSFPKTDYLSQVQVIDLLGKGTACLVWSSPLPNEGYSPVRYIDLMAGTLIEEGLEAGHRVNCKPYLLTEVRNNMGAITRLRYEPSTKFYLEDRRAGNPWITKLPFPVQVLTRVETFDDISKNAFVNHYAYHHGYFDEVEREFRGFGMVEQWDTEDLSLMNRDDNFQPLGTNWSEETDLPPVHTKTWFHTGFYKQGNRISRQYQEEYFRVFQRNAIGEIQLDDNGGPLYEDWLLPDTHLPDDLTTEEIREAARALKGTALRQEVYGLDGSLEEGIPYVVTESNFQVQRLQEKGENKYAVFLVSPSEALTYHYERNPEDPRIAHQFTLEVDPYGNTTKTASVVYPRRMAVTGLPEQNEMHILYAENEFINQEEEAFRRIGVGWMEKTFEVQVPESAPFEFTTLRNDILGATTIAYHEEVGDHQKRLLNCAVISFYNEALDNEMPLGSLSSWALPYRAYQAAFTRAMLEDTNDWFEGRVDAGLLQSVELGYLSVGGLNFPGATDLTGLEGSFWSHSGRLEFAPTQFYLPVQQIDPFGHLTEFRYDVHTLLLAQSFTTVDGVVLETSAINDYRLLQPYQMTDPNENISEVVFDTLGMVVLTVLRDNAGNGDEMPDPVPAFDHNTLYSLMDVGETEARRLLGTATSRMIYDLWAYYNTRDDESPQPNYVHSITRERHYSQEGGSAPRLQLQHAISYSDGFGREILTKVQAEEGEAPAYDISSGSRTLQLDPNGYLQYQDTAELVGVRRWVGNGRTIFNNKGLPVRQYEPFFDSHPFFTEEDLLRLAGVSPVLRYDPLGRNIYTLFPDGTHSRVEFTPWLQVTYDQLDTLNEPNNETNDANEWFEQRINRSVAEEFEEERYFGVDPGSIIQQVQAAENAARQAITLAGTPNRTYLDSLGRPFLTIVHNRFVYSNGETGDIFIPTRSILDIVGNPLTIYDGRRSIVGMPLSNILAQAPSLIGNAVVNYRYAMNGEQIFQRSMDAGNRWSLTDVSGKPVRLWDGMERVHRTVYDELQRPTHQWVTDNDGTEVLVERMIYGELAPDAITNKLRGQLYLHFDGAGMLRNETFDFKGNLEQSSRRLYRTTYHLMRNSNPSWREIIPDWQIVVGSDAANAENDAIPVLEEETFTVATLYDALNRPYRTENHYDSSVQYPVYNEAGLLDNLQVDLQGNLTSLVRNIDYNEKGQRTKIQFGNRVTTTYQYDKNTYRLLQMRTTRYDAPDVGNQGPVFQELNYTYDPAGNITEVRDNAIEPVYFNNQRVDGHSTYTYDAIYQLIEATGRESYSVQGQSSHREQQLLPVPQFPITNQTLRNYRQIYHYDPAGNIAEMNHLAQGGDWTREYRYALDSNRLEATPLSYHAAFENYSYDAHGSMTSMPHLERMGWDYKDQLVHVNIRGNGEAFYTYDSQRQRVRKLVFNGSGRSERIYLGGLEIYRDTGADGRNPTNELQTIHIMDDQQRVCMIETPVGSTARYRYQLSNHLGSAMVELDEEARIISYEEYHPYGSTAYRVRRGDAEVSAKRYRYTGMERDEETGLNYHGARYYVAWLGRWGSVDPARLNGGINLYRYSKNNPIGFLDVSGKVPIPANVFFLSPAAAAAAPAAAPPAAAPAAAAPAAANSAFYPPAAASSLTPTASVGAQGLLTVAAIALIGHLFIKRRASMRTYQNPYGVPPETEYPGQRLERQRQVELQPQQYTQQSSPDVPANHQTASLPPPTEGKDSETLVSPAPAPAPAPKQERKERKKKEKVNLDTGAIVRATSLGVTEDGLEGGLVAIHAYLKDKDIVITETAFKEFFNGSAKAAGPRESILIFALMLRVRIISDNPSQEVLDLKPNSEQKQNMKNYVRDQVIFGTGHEEGYTTVSTDYTFIVRAIDHGINLKAVAFDSASYSGR